MQIFTLLDNLHNFVLLLLLLPLFLFFLYFEHCDEAISIPVAVNELFPNFFKVSFPVASLDHFNDFLFSFLLKFLLLLFLFRNHVSDFIIVPIMLLQIHLGHIVIAIKVLGSQLEAHIIFSLLLLLLLKFLLSLLLLLFIKDSRKLIVHLLVFFFFLLLDFFTDDLLGLLLPIDPLIHTVLLCLSMWFDFLVELSEEFLFIFCGDGRGFLLRNFHLQKL